MTCTNAHIGRAQAIGIAKESTSWTLSAWTKFWLPKEGWIMKPVVETVKDQGGYWVIESDYDSQVAREITETDLNGIVDNVSIGILLKATFGTEASVAKWSPNGAVYDHTFTVLQTNNHPSLSIWAYDPVGTYTSTYNMVKELKITANMWEYVKFDVQMVWKKMVSASTPTVGYASNSQFLARHVKLYVATSEAWLDSADPIQLNSIEFTINKNVEMTGIDLEPDCFLNQNFVISGSLESVFVNNTDWLALTQGATEKFFRIKILNTDVTIGSTANPELSFTFAKAVFTEWDKSDDNDTIVTQTVWFVGHFNNTDGFSVKAKLSNTQSAVY